MNRSSRLVVIWLSLAVLAILGFAVAGSLLPASSPLPAVAAGILTEPTQGYWPPQPPPGGPAWTLMFYLPTGYENDPKTQVAVMNQLERAANDNSGVQAVALYDGFGKFDSKYYKINHDETPQLASQTFSVNWRNEVDMGDKKTLSDFIRWTREHYPAQHYALIIKAHGSGLGGLALDNDDSLLGDHVLTLKELGEALSEAGLGQKLDVLVAHSCLMGMIEVAYEIRNSAYYYVASEESILNVHEHYYDFLRGINRSSTAEDVARWWSTTFRKVLDVEAKGVVGGFDWTGYKMCYTISVVNLLQTPKVVWAINDLASSLISGMMVPNSSAAQMLAKQLEEARVAAQKFDVKSDCSLDENDSYVDLVDFALEITGRVSDPIIRQKALTLADAVKNLFVLHNGGNFTSGAKSICQKHVPINVEFGNGMPRIRINERYAVPVDLSGSNGVSVFFPKGMSSFYNKDNYGFAVGAEWSKRQGLSALGASASDGSLAVEWGPMLVAFFELTQPGGPDNPNPPEVVEAPRVNFEANSGNISGCVLVQGAGDHSGSAVSCGSFSTSTAADGSFSVDLPEGSYTCTANRSRCLTAQCTGVSASALLPDVTLAVGDANSDGRIDVYDLVIMSRAYGTAPPSDFRADMNGDNVVNVYDLVLSSTNYGRTAPTPW